MCARKKDLVSVSTQLCAQATAFVYGFDFNSDAQILLAITLMAESVPFFRSGQLQATLERALSLKFARFPYARSSHNSGWFLPLLCGPRQRIYTPPSFAPSLATSDPRLSSSLEFDPVVKSSPRPNRLAACKPDRRTA